jgi:hypothetical protein
MSDARKSSGRVGTPAEPPPEVLLARAPSNSDPMTGPRADLAKAIPRRPRVRWWTGLVIAFGFALLIVPSITADRWLSSAGLGEVTYGKPAPVTVRVPPFAGYTTKTTHVGGGGGVVIARGDIATRDDVTNAADVREAMPHGPVSYLAYFLLIGVLAGVFSHHARRSTRGRLVRVQLVSLGLIAVAAVAVKLLMLATAISVLAVPVALFAIVPTLALDRIVGLALGTLFALVCSLLVPFDFGVAILLLVSAGTAGLVVAEQPKHRWRAVLAAGGVATLFTGVTYPLMHYLTTGQLPLAELHNPLHSAWVATAIGPAIATVLAVPLLPLYQLMVGEITRSKLIELEDLSHPLLRQISERAPGTWQHSLMMANMAEIAANSIGASGRMVRVGAYFHDLGKSLQPKYFIENLEPGETSPHDRLPPEASCDAIFAHVTEGIVTARNAGLHERIVDFMHMHHGNGVLEYFWAKCREQGNDRELTIEHFRYPGVPPQSRETAILAICDAVEAASRTLKKPDAASIDHLVQRIVYGKLHLGQLDESGLSMSDLRRVSDSLRETIRHANHNRIEYPWQKAQQDASASGQLTTTSPRLDSLDRPARPEAVKPPAPSTDDAHADTAGVATPKLRVGSRDPGASDIGIGSTAPVARVDVDDAPRAPAVRADPSSVHELGPRDAPLPPDASLDSGQLAQAMSDRLERRPTRVERVRSPTGVEMKQLVSDAVDALNETSKEVAALPREVAEVPSAVRKRAATLPPMPVRRPPTVQPPIAGARPPTEPPAGESRRTGTDPPPSFVRPPSAPPPPPPAQMPSGTTPTFASSTPSPPPELAQRPSHGVRSDDPGASLRRTGERVAVEPSDDTSTTHPRMFRAVVDDDPSASASNLEVGDATQPRLELPLRAPAMSDPSMRIPAQDSGWRSGLAARIDAALDDDAPPPRRSASRPDDSFGGDTPVSPPTRAEMQALRDAPPDPTRQQSFEEIERLHRAAQEARPSEPELFQRRVHPTTEVDDADIEAAIELAPPARRHTIGVAKKKPPE